VLAERPGETHRARLRQSLEEPRESPESVSAALPDCIGDRRRVFQLSTGILESRQRLRSCKGVMLTCRSWSWPSAPRSATRFATSAAHRSWLEEIQERTPRLVGVPRPTPDSRQRVERGPYQAHRDVKPSTCLVHWAVDLGFWRHSSSYTRCDIAVVGRRSQARLGFPERPQAGVKRRIADLLSSHGSQSADQLFWRHLAVFLGPLRVFHQMLYLAFRDLKRPLNVAHDHECPVVISLKQQHERLAFR
jgi:hypothetical protein